jgi:hypothetical protein
LKVFFAAFFILLNLHSESHAAVESEPTLDPPILCQTPEKPAECLEALKPSLAKIKSNHPFWEIAMRSWIRTDRRAEGLELLAKRRNEDPKSNFGDLIERFGYSFVEEKTQAEYMTVLFDLQSLGYLRARATLEKLLKKEPSNLLLKVRYSQLLFLEGEWKKAYESTEGWKALLSHQPIALMWLGWIEFQATKYKDSEAAFLEAYRRLGTDNEAALSGLLELYAKTDRIKEAVELVKKVRAKEPDHFRWNYQWAQLQWDLARKEEREDIWRPRLKAGLQKALDRFEEYLKIRVRELEKMGELGLFPYNAYADRRQAAQLMQNLDRY